MDYRGLSVRRLLPFMLFFHHTSTPPSIHSRSTEPTELQEPTVTQGIYGNVKILTSANARHTQYSANLLHSTPSTFYFHCRRLLTPLNGFPRQHTCLSLFNLVSVLLFMYRLLFKTDPFLKGRPQRTRERGGICTGQSNC